MNSSETVQQVKSAAETDPEVIERDIDRTRGRVDETLEELQARLSPGQMLDKALQYVRANGGELAGNLGRQIKENPVPLVLTGVGLVWLMSASRQEPGGDRIGESGANAAAKLRQSASATYDRTAAAAQGAAARARQLSGSTAELMREQPLVIGLLGLAAGALIGALLPPTETEDRIAGRTGDRLSESAKDAVSGAFQHVRDAAKDAVDSTRDSTGDASRSPAESTRPH